jgi:hypothetical protein
VTQPERRLQPGRVIVVNAGSSSLKVRVLGPADGIDAAFDLDH